MNIVVTGASKGIGKAIAAIFCSPINQVFICARDENELSKVAIELVSEKPGAVINFFPADLSGKDGVLKFAKWLQGRNIKIDILVNNAGQFLPGSVYNEPEGTLEKMIAVNLCSAYYLTRALLPGMMKAK
ncbi:MAG: SDR family NAD(P)-dependent oxidoreductase, partial [Ginsengibacter sp.]